MDKTTQTIHKFHIADSPAGPLELAYNLESGWFAATLPPQIPFEYMDVLLVALGIIRKRWQTAGEDGTAIRSAESDINADWKALNRLVKKE